MQQNVGCFPSLYDPGELYPENPDFPKIHITGVPSAFGQTKLAGQQLDRWIASGAVTDTADAIDTAVVLPDESLFIPMVHAVPPSFSALNVTMGFPLKNTAVSSLYVGHRKSSSQEFPLPRRVELFYEDMRAVLTHPMLRAMLLKDAMRCCA